MKLIIAGSRDVPARLCETFILDAFYGRVPVAVRDSITEVVHGGCRGIDQEAGRLFKEYGVKVFPADWTTHGRAAGPIRNRQMAEYADALLLIWDGKSRGSANMKKEMGSLGKPVYEYVVQWGVPA